MQRVDSFGNTGSLPASEAQVNAPGFFTIGNPSLSVPATVVPAWWLNSVQEELAAVIEAAGITLAKGTNNQLLSAIGGLSQNNQEATFAIANNQSTFADITGMILDKTIYYGAEIIGHVYRKDAGQEVSSFMKVRCLFSPVANAWELIGPEFIGTDPGITDLEITSTGQVRYKSSNFAGGSYVGELRFKMNRFKI